MRHIAGDTKKRVLSSDAGSAAGLKTEVYGALEWPRIAGLWAELARVSPYRSFYLSAEWIGAWLEIFGESFHPTFLLFREGARPVGVCLLARVKERRGPFRIQRMTLNCGGEPESERTLMEFNGILCRGGKEDAVADAVGQYVSGERWDEFEIHGIVPGPMLDALQANAFPTLTASIRLQPTYSVDLRELRQQGKQYVDAVSANTRGQIRRSMKRYGGSVQVEIATDLATAQSYFEEMCVLHQARWTGRGETGAFQPGRRSEFHRALIRRAFSGGGIHMVRVLAAHGTVGILYNFVEAGKIYFFQSGFRYGNDSRLKPGLVTHACAIQNYLELGFDEYDFLAGRSRYKASLGKESKALAWVVFARPGIKLATIELLRTVKRRLRK